APACLHAADLEPVSDEEFAMEAPILDVEAQRGWYIRGDLGYHFDDGAYDDGFAGVSVSDRAFGGSIGAGYQFNDLFRMDANVGLLSGARVDDGAARFDTRVWSGLVNGYVDVGTIVGFTPY